MQLNDALIASWKVKLDESYTVAYLITLVPCWARSATNWLCHLLARQRLLFGLQIQEPLR